MSGLLNGGNESIVVDGTAITLGTTSAGTTVINNLAYTATVAGGTATVMLSGGTMTAAATQALVNGITYQNTDVDAPAAGNRVFTLTQIMDSGGTANGGMDTTILSIASTVTVAPINDPPIATNLNASETYTEDTPLVLTAIGISDIDSPNLTATLTLSNLAAGSLSTATNGSVTSFFNAATGAWSASGAIGDVQALLVAATFTPSLNFNGNFSIATLVSDGTTTLTGNKVVTGIAVNDAPTATNLNAAQTYTEDTPLNLTDIVVSDVDSANVIATLTLSNAAVGSLSTATSGSVTSNYNPRHRRMDRKRRARGRQHVAGQCHVQSDAQFQRQFHDRHAGERRRRGADQRHHDDHRHRGQRRADRGQPERAGNVHRGHAAESGQPRDHRRRQRQRDGDADPVECRSGRALHRHFGCE